MKFYNHLFLGIGLSLLLGFFISTHAVQASKTMTSDFHNWEVIYLNIPLTPKLTTTLETQNRIQNNWQNEANLFIRPSLTYKLTPRFSITGGYSWNPNFTVHEPRFHNEQRIWEQIQYTHPLTHDFELTLRTRLEERFIEGSAHTGWRGVQMIKLTHPIPFLDKKRFYLATYDVLFVNMNTVNRNTVSGIDQNRDFIGIGTRLSRGTVLETGYVLNYSHKVYTPSKLVHALVFNLTYTLGEPIFKKSKSPRQIDQKTHLHEKSHQTS